MNEHIQRVFIKQKYFRAGISQTEHAISAGEKEKEHHLYKIEYRYAVKVGGIYISYNHLVVFTM